MKIKGEPRAFLSNEARQLLNLYESLGERAEIFLPRHIYDNLTSFVKLCFEEPDDPTAQQAEINRYLLKFREDIPGYTDVSLMIYPTNQSKAFEISDRRKTFVKKIDDFLETKTANPDAKVLLKNIQKSHDLSVGTPPIKSNHIEFISQVQLGGQISILRKYRDVIGVTGDLNEAHWNYLMDTLEQMISQSTHYTTSAETADFLNRARWAVNFKGLNGMIPTVVSGRADKAVELLRGDVFSKEAVIVMENPSSEDLYNAMLDDTTSIFVVKVRHSRVNPYSGDKWFPLLTRIVIVDDSRESRSSNTSLVFCFHNGIINALNKVHTKKLGAPANTQMNLRLILESVNPSYLAEFREKIEIQIASYEQEIKRVINDQLNGDNDPIKQINLFKLDLFSRKIVEDKFSLERLRDFIYFLENCHKQELRQEQTRELIEEFELRMRQYFYSSSEHIEILSVLEGGGRNQIRTYGKYLLQKPYKPLSEKVIRACRLILDIIPSNYERTLKNHFHKNFGINLFLEKYQAYISKIENESNNKGRYDNFLNDLGIREKYYALSPEEQSIVKEFLAALGNLEQTSVSDSVQMIIRDLLFNSNGRPKPYIIYNAMQAWEYKDLLPDDTFDINPFDIEIENLEDGRLAYQRLHDRLTRIKSTLSLFDESGSLWDLFCDNTTILLNDPNNPTGYTDFNCEAVNNFLRLINSSKITLFLDEAYADSVKVDGENMPKWRSLSRYIINNIQSQANIKAVSSLSTTKNLSATGDRLGALAVTPQAKDVVEYVRKHNSASHGNNCSLLMLNNLLEIAQISKRIKDILESELPKSASRHKIKETITKFILEQIGRTKQYNATSKTDRQLHKTAGFEGSPLYIFLLDELLALDKLDVLAVPDDFKYDGKPFYVEYQRQLVSNLNKFRVNKNFRTESLERLSLAKEAAIEVSQKFNNPNIEWIASDGSYLFNFRIRGGFSYADILTFSQYLSLYRGVAVVPYPTGLVRFSVGGYLEDKASSLTTFKAELKDAFTIFMRYWEIFSTKRVDPSFDEVESHTILDQIFDYGDKDKELMRQILQDYEYSSSYKRDKAPSLQLRDIRTLYHASPERSGVSITTIDRSVNSVIELHGDKIGSCRDVSEFIRSAAFTKVYETLLAQIYKSVPDIADLDFNTVSSKYGKAVILKYITNKKGFQPNDHVLDDPADRNVMREILIEMEHILFSDSKMKILAIDATGNAELDKAKLEGINVILKKYIREILIHFNLNFEKSQLEPSRCEIVSLTGEVFEEIVGIPISELNLQIWVDEFINRLREQEGFKESRLSQKSIGYIMDTIAHGIGADKSITDRILYLYLLHNDDSFFKLVIQKLKFFSQKIEELDDAELKMVTEEFITEILPRELQEISSYIMRRKDIKITEDEIHIVSRKVVLFFISMIKRTKGTDYYKRYTHTMVRIVETAFRKQNSSINQMVQHGISLYRGFEMKNTTLEEFNGGAISWINRLMSKCGVIASEQAVQEHTRIVTDAKKREYPFHKVDRACSKDKNGDNKGGNEYLRLLELRPDSEFFSNRLARFIETMDADDYRCKIVKHGMVKELVVFQKGYMKYLTDNYRLNYTEDITLDDIQNFVPDVISFLGAPEKLISFPQIGYFDIKGPNGNIKCIVTPLKQKADYFGDVKKPRLTIINEKIKEMGGSPRHGSLFAVEENDGSIFVIEINGDSGVGKSEMIAAFILKWLRNNLEGIRSVKFIAGDMFHEFQDAQGNLYGVGTEIGDFSRTTDFDPDYIKYYKYLFENSADSNVEDLNSRSTLSGMCDITMPYKIDIMLSAGNYSKEEAGITRIDNPENFLLYIDSHGERKEKATSQDGPNFQRTLKRYTADKNIVDVMARHGNYLDDILDWEFDPIEKIYYLASSFKLIDKIDLTQIVNQIFSNKCFTRKKERWNIKQVSFDIIHNRFIAQAINIESGIEERMLIDRAIFSSIYDAIASTPGGQPFIAEEGQLEVVMSLVKCMNGGADGKGKAKNIKCGIISTEIGKKGREITGPQKAAMELKNLIQEVRINRPEINQGKRNVKRLINEKYFHIFKGAMNSSEIWRYNFFIYQLEEMRKADYRRMDDISMSMDMSNLVNFHPVDPSHQFSPLLVNPNLNIELSSFSETYQELMSLPNYSEFAQEFTAKMELLYHAQGYSSETNINNMIIQLLLLEGYVTLEDVARGSVIEKVNRETIAAAKYAVIKHLSSSPKEMIIEYTEEVVKPSKKGAKKQ
ncbi:MAG: aminotransferase class I/II-fold pyridoxal phosphate-dependent enzyme [Bacteroidales bacterium]